MMTHAQCADFYCPLTNVIMFDPVIAEDGLTYERSAIERYLEVHDTSPCVRARTGEGFLPIGKQVKSNLERKAALDRIVRDYNHDDEPEIISWDGQGLQQYLPDPRSVALASPTSLEPLPAASPRAVADMTRDLTKMFRVLDPLRAELNTLTGLTPPKIVVIGDESSGKSTVLEQLIRMPLFPRKKTFCTRLPIHVRLRRPDAAQDECASVTMSVITAKAYAEHGYDAKPEEGTTPCTISTASGYHFVQDRMDELSNSLAGETGGVICNRIIVLNVLHPDVPVLDLIDLPGLVAVDVPGVTPPGKVEAIERVISHQIAADRQHGMTSFYLVIVPCERPNTSNTFKLIQREGLLDHAIGVLTKSDEIKDPRYLLAWMMGEDIEDEDDGTVSTAAALGEVSLAKGWTATMLEMPKKIVTVEGGRKVNYYTAHAAERLKKQEESELRFFGGPDAHEVMRKLYDNGLAGTGALAAKLTREYFEYSRGDWLKQTLTRLLEYELQLRSDRALLGATDSVTKDELAAKEVAGTMDEGTKALTQRFVREKLLEAGTLFSPSWLSREFDRFKAGVEVGTDEIDSTLMQLQRTIYERFDEAVQAVETFYADEIKQMLDASVRVLPDEGKAGAALTDDASKGPAPVVHSMRFWMDGVRLVRSLFGTSVKMPDRAIDVHKQVIAQPIIQLGAYPDFTKAIADVVKAECSKRRVRIEQAAKAILDHLTADVTQYVRIVPHQDMQRATIYLAVDAAGNVLFFDALKTAFMRYLPTHAQLKEAVLRKDIKLSSFEEDAETARKRRDLDVRLRRVRDATRSLVRALDVDESKPLDSTWLAELQRESGLPPDDRVLYTEGELATALSRFEAFHRIEVGSATVEQLQRSSAKIGGWLRASADMLAVNYLSELLKAKAVNYLSEGEGVGSINEKTTALFLLLEGCSQATKDAALAALEPIATAKRAVHIQSVEWGGDAKEELFFFYVPTDEGQLRELAKLGAATGTPQMVLLDLHLDSGGFYVSDATEISADTITAFLEAYQAGALERKQLGCRLDGLPPPVVMQRPLPTAPGAHDAGIEYGEIAADIAADSMAAHIAAMADNMPHL